MDFGLIMFPAHYAIPVAELAREAEARGFESLFLPEHTHIPASRKSPWPGGAELPKHYYHAQDPFVALGSAAAVTSRIKLATGICLVIERDPIVLAKEVASLDLVSGGRFLFGIGGGWNAEEMANHGTDFSGRWGVLRERVEAMKAIWTQDEATYHGKHVNFERIWSWPKPVQQPHPPILVGGDGERTLQRVVRYGDGWMPIVRPNADPTVRMDELRRLAQEAGRGDIPVTLFGAPPKPEVVEGYQAKGVARCLFMVAPEGRDQVLPRLDTLAEVARRFA